MSDLSLLAAQILVSLSPLLAGANVDPPRTVAVAPAKLQMMACAKPCRVLAWYSPAGTIYLDRRLDLVGNLQHQSILVHELVHHTQRLRRGRRARDCGEWLDREQAAYLAQARWLRARGQATGSLMRATRLLRCMPDTR